MKKQNKKKRQKLDKRKQHNNNCPQRLSDIFHCLSFMIYTMRPYENVKKYFKS